MTLDQLQEYCLANAVYAKIDGDTMIAWCFTVAHDDPDVYFDLLAD